VLREASGRRLASGQAPQPGPAPTPDADSAADGDGGGERRVQCRSRQSWALLVSVRYLMTFLTIARRDKVGNMKRIMCAEDVSR
jgi:hypothetical protein